MSMIFNNTELTAVEFNGVDLDEVYFNNELVFKKGGGGGILRQGILSKSYPSDPSFIAEFVNNYSRVHLSTPDGHGWYANCACCFEIDFDEVNEITIDWEIVRRNQFGVAIGIGTHGELNNNEQGEPVSRAWILDVDMLMYPAGTFPNKYSHTFDVSMYSGIKYLSFSTDEGDEAYIDAVFLG